MKGKFIHIANLQNRIKEVVRCIGFGSINPETLKATHIEQEYSVLLANKVMLPETFEMNDRFIVWRRKATDALLKIQKIKALPDIDETYKEIASFLMIVENISLVIARRKFCNNQLKKIGDAGIDINRYRHVFNDDTIDDFYVIFSDVRIKNAFDAYVIRGEYLDMTRALDVTRYYPNRYMVYDEGVW